MNNVKIAEVMTKFPHTIGEDQNATVAKKMMHQYNVRHLPVQFGGQLTGIISERDLYFALEIDRKDAEDVLVRDIYTAEPYTVTSETLLVDVANYMAETGIGCTLIVDSGKLSGIFTTVDACRYLGKLLS